MAEYYLALRHAHIGFVILSIGLFVLRGVLMLVESQYVQSAWLRYPSYAIDTLLLTAALMLTSVVHQYPFGNGWLTMKVALLVVSSCSAASRSSADGHDGSGSPLLRQPCSRSVSWSRWRVPTTPWAFLPAWPPDRDTGHRPPRGVALDLASRHHA